MKSRFIILAVTAAIAPLVHGVTTFDFDGATPSSTIGDPLPAAVTLETAYYETLDSLGDPLAIPGFRADTSPIVTGNPSLAGYGAAITGDALDATSGPVMFTFASALNLSNFSVSLDNSPYGSVPQIGGNPAFGTNVLFYDADDNLLGNIPLDQTVSGFAITNDSGSFLGVKKLILPSGAFYDNVSFTAVIPEPSAAALACVGALLLGKRRRARTC